MATKEELSGEEFGTPDTETITALLQFFCKKIPTDNMNCVKCCDILRPVLAKEGTPLMKNDNYRVGQKTGPFLRVYNFATVHARNARDMSKFS